MVSLIGQIVLSISLLIVTAVSDRIVQTANEYATIATSQSFKYQNVAVTIRRFTEEIEADTPNERLIQSIQARLLEQATQLRGMARRIDEAVEHQTGIWFVSVDKAGESFRDAKPQLDTFIDSLKLLSAMPLESLLLAQQHFDRIDLAIAPTSNIAMAIYAVTDELVEKASRVSQALFFTRFFIVAAMTGIVVYIGFCLILPALQNLAKAMRSERKLRLQVERMAQHDTMTGLLNREGLDRVVASLKHDQVYGLAIIDLNLFKTINDTFGHASGDAVLAELGTRLRIVCTSKMFVARIGGDEFAVLDPTARSKDDCDALGAKLVSVFDKPILFMNRSHTLGGAIGIVLSHQIDGGFSAVSKAADAAMYALKGSRKTGYEIYSIEKHVSATDLNRKSEIQKALQEHSIRPWYQPKMDMLTGEPIGFEALARWHTDREGVLAPGKFLNDVNQFGLHFDLAYSMFEQVLKQMREWSQGGFQPLPVAVNISAEALVSQDSLNDLRWLLAEYKDVTSLLTMEITEDVFLPRIAEPMKASIAQLLEDGVRFSIDDFGSGYASFQHLKDFTFHELKIDKAFVDGIKSDTTSEVILCGLVAIAHGLDVDVVAEGIETEEQADFLLGLGCRIGQGFLFSKPIPSDATWHSLTPRKTDDRSKAS